MKIRGLIVLLLLLIIALWTAIVNYLRAADTIALLRRVLRIARDQGVQFDDTTEILIKRIVRTERPSWDE
jgi:hypothetical protein